MTYQIVESDNTKVNGDNIKDLMTRINDTGVVCLGDVISIESGLGCNILPKQVTNRITAMPSRNGYNELIAAVELRVEYSESLTSTHLVIMLLETVAVLTEANIPSALDRARTDLDALCKLYVPQHIVDRAPSGAASVGDLPVSILVRDSQAAATYAAVKSNILQHIGRMENVVSYGRLAVLANRVSEQDIPSRTLCGISYAGTVREYAMMNIEALDAINRYGVDNTRTVLRNDYDDCRFGYLSRCVYGDTKSVNYIASSIAKDSFGLS